jgi:hypothetical protein
VCDHSGAGGSAGVVGVSISTVLRGKLIAGDVPRMGLKFIAVFFDVM